MGIETYLSELADLKQPLKTARLSRLSHLDQDEQRVLAECWPTLPLERRRAVLERITALAEDNPELDFDAVFLTALRDTDGVARRLAVEGLWEHEERDVIPLLVRLVRSDPDAGVRAAAALALGRFVLLAEFGEVRPGDAVCITDTLRAVIDDTAENVEVRGRAVEAIGACSQPWVRGIIERAYTSGEPRLVVSALHAMGRSADRYWLPTLFQEVTSADPELRYEAAGALGAIEDPEAVPYLAPLLDDEDSEVQEAAIQALGEIGGREAIRLLRRRLADADERVRAAVEAALEQAEFGDDPLGLTL